MSTSALSHELPKNAGKLPPRRQVIAITTLMQVSYVVHGAVHKTYCKIEIRTYTGGNNRRFPNVPVSVPIHRGSVRSGCSRVAEGHFPAPVVVLAGAVRGVHEGAARRSGPSGLRAWRDRPLAVAQGHPAGTIRVLDDTRSPRGQGQREARLPLS